ncbi:MAG TPA: lysophospholipid acyltransferase family protein [Thermodesulfobacteriota bacterium]|nr:lysophospholipid acyltransferase family protein [Thermodesulfobacteriota bacterium]
MLIRTLLVWLVGLPVTIFIFIIVIISLAFDRSGNSIHSIGALWSRILLFLSGVTVEIKGAENLFQDSPQILASNHRGAFDILALQGFIPIQFRWVAKKSLFKIPIIGWSMSLAGYVSIDREKAGSAYKSIERAAEKVKKGASVLIFPEGTRSSAGSLLPFKRGGFLLAIKSGVPIVPVSIRGTENLMKKESILIRPGAVKVVIGKPISTEGVDEKVLMNEVRKAIEEELS